VFISYIFKINIQPECASLLVGTDKYHIQVSHYLRVGKNALNEYDPYAIYTVFQKKVHPSAFRNN